MSLRFNGTSSYAQTPSTIDLTAVTAITISFWGYFTNGSTNNQIAIESSVSSSVNTNTFYYNHNQTAGNTQLRVRNVGSSQASFTNASLNQWHYYVITIDLSLGGQPFVVYVDGVSQSLSYLTSAQDCTSFKNYPWNFMARNGSAFFVPGRMAEVALFPSVVLSQNEALALYYGISPLDLRSDVKPYYWAMEGDAQLYAQDYSGRLNDLITSNVTLDNHPPIPVDFFGWDEMPVLVTPAVVGQILEGSFNITSKLTNSNNGQKSISVVINILDKFNLQTNPRIAKNGNIRARVRTNNRYATAINKSSNFNIRNSSRFNPISQINKFGSITIDSVLRFNEFVTVNKAVALNITEESSAKFLSAVDYNASIDIGINADTNIVLGNIIIGGFELNCAISNTYISSVNKQVNTTIDAAFNQTGSALKDSTAQINIDGSIKQTILGSISHYTIIEIEGKSYAQFELVLDTPSVEFTPLKTVYVTIPLDTMIEKVLKIH